MREIRLNIPDFIYHAGVWILLHYRRLRYGFPFRKIPLTQGKFAIVDAEDFETLNKYKWNAVRNGQNFYAQRYGGKCGQNQVKGGIKMHREIMKMPQSWVVDHINQNSLDNRKANLRLATREQNSWNIRKVRGKKSSQCKGVSYCKRDKRWAAYITYRKKHIFIGRFDDEQAAAKAYDEKAKELFGQYAYLNFPDS